MTLISSFWLHPVCCYWKALVLLSQIITHVDRDYRSLFTISLTALATSQPDGLTVLLQLCDELVALLHYVAVLPVLVVWSVRLDDALDAVDSAWDAVCGDELGEIPG